MFGISNNIKSRVVRICTPSLLRQAINSSRVADVCAQIRDALEQSRRGEITTEEFEKIKSRLKKQLPILTPHATFKNGRRLNKEAVPSGLSMYDIDHIPNPMGRWEEIAPRKEELGIVFAHITPSTEGLRLFFVLPQGMDLAQAQAWMAQQLGDSQYDACVKDYARSSFVVPREYVLFLDEKGLFNEAHHPVILNVVERSEESGPTPDGSLRSRSFTGVQDDNGGEDDNKGGETETRPSVILNETECSEDVLLRALPEKSGPMPDGSLRSRSFTGVQDDKRRNDNNTRSVILSVVERSEESGPTPDGSLRSRSFTGVQDDNEGEYKNKKLCGTPCNSVVQEKYPQTYEGIAYKTIVEVLEEQMGGQPEHGSRNNFIFSMACHLRYICNDEAEWIASILPTYGEARDKWMASIRSACARSQTQTMPRIMKRTLRICNERLATTDADQEENPNLPPAMPHKLPPLIKLLVSRTPEVYKPAVAHAVFPALATHLWKTTFRYIDNVEHEATLMNVLMAGTGAGKNCISEPINRILADIRRSDRENLKREKEWKKEMLTKGANKDKRQRPEGLVIQEIDPDMTNAAFVQRLADAEERFLYTKMNEIDQFDALKTSSRSKAHFQIMCLAFDPGNVYGQTRVGTGSVSERVCIRFNWNASTTISKGKSYFRNVLTDGPISRINFCTIPEREIGAPLPVYGSYDAAFDEELRPYIERLNKARGLIACPQAEKLALKLMEENADFSRLSESRVYENLSFRANVIAYLKAMVLYVAQGEVWDRTLEEFIRWSLEYDMWCKMQFFGGAIEEVEGTTEYETKGPRNLLDLLPEVFTREEAGQMRLRQGVRQGTLKGMLGNWKLRGYIEPYGMEYERKNIHLQKYAKTESYLKKHPQGTQVLSIQ